jgi:predicted 3-demethylubiquinone-9 3-methyltransferase (glyoxalase superfamily)
MRSERLGSGCRSSRAVAGNRCRPPVFRTTVYRAANWMYVGNTRGVRRIRLGYTPTPQSPRWSSSNLYGPIPSSIHIFLNWSDTEIMQSITPHLWFDSEAKEAASFYASVFPNSNIRNITTLRDTPWGDCDVVSFELSRQPLMAISAGPLFKFNPSVSFLFKCRTKDEVDALWKKLSDGGKVRVPLDSYPFSERFGWVEDHAHYHERDACRPRPRENCARNAGLPQNEKVRHRCPAPGIRRQVIQFRLTGS